MSGFAQKTIFIGNPFETPEKTKRFVEHSLAHMKRIAAQVGILPHHNTLGTSDTTIYHSAIGLLIEYIEREKYPTLVGEDSRDALLNVAELSEIWCQAPDTAGFQDRRLQARVDDFGLHVPLAHRMRAHWKEVAFRLYEHDIKLALREEAGQRVLAQINRGLDEGQVRGHQRDMINIALASEMGKVGVRAVGKVATDFRASASQGISLQSSAADVLYAQRARVARTPDWVLKGDSYCRPTYNYTPYYNL